ncbi:MAG: lipid-A-disaccharide synthase [Marinilabiliaceae bacterium]
MRYYIVAGEPSGDLHGSNLMKALRSVDPEASFSFWGGDLMKAAGGRLVRHYKDTAVMGVWDVLTHLGKIQRNFKLCRKDILADKPDAIIFIDYPGFNLPMAEWAKRQGFKVLYYISPKVWASKEYRIKKIKRYVDRVYSILPFEPAYFAKHELTNVFYCGNPVMDAIAQRPHSGESKQDFKLRNGLSDKPIIALLPGSRVSELKYNLPQMLRLVNDMPQFQFVIGGAPSFTSKDYEPFLYGVDVKVLFGETYGLVSSAEAAVVTSGTATLETAILNCPQIVMYLMWGGWFSDWVAHLFIKVPFISLVNLILGRESVSELFQRRYSYERLLSELRELSSESSRRAKMLADYEEMRAAVGGAGCSHRAAVDMCDFLRSMK